MVLSPLAFPAAGARATCVADPGSRPQNSCTDAIPGLHNAARAALSARESKGRGMRGPQKQRHGRGDAAHRDAVGHPRQRVCETGGAVCGGVDSNCADLEITHFDACRGFPPAMRVAHRRVPRRGNDGGGRVRAVLNLETSWPRRYEASRRRRPSTTSVPETEVAERGEVEAIVRQLRSRVVILVVGSRHRGNDGRGGQRQRYTDGGEGKVGHKDGVIPELVPGIHLSAGDSVCGALAPGNRCRDDNGVERAAFSPLHSWPQACVERAPK